MFHYCTTTYDYSKTVVDFFATMMKPLIAPDRNFSLALLYRDDAFGNGVAAATKYWIAQESLPMTIVSDLKYTTTTTDFQTLLTQTKGASPDAVFIAENPDKSPTIIQQGLTEVGLQTVYMNVENNQDPQFYSLLGSLGDNQLLESKMDPFMNPSYLPMIPQFVQAYSAANNGTIPGMMGADTYDAFFIAKAAIESAGTLDKAAVRTAIEQTNLNDMLLLTPTGKIQFSTGINYHEINPVTFIEQLKYNATLGRCESVIIWPESVSGVGTIKQADFIFPSGYPNAPTPTVVPTASIPEIPVPLMLTAVAVMVIATLTFAILKRKTQSA
jgi:branched-chain amino acid transport system substrate-binding protein